MLIAIISDIHDNLANLKKCLDWNLSNGVEKIICCGDVTNLDTIDYLAKTFSGEIFLVGGNMELYEEKDLDQYKNISYSGEIGLRELGGLSLGFCHEPAKTRRVLKLSLAAPDFIFYGHTHKPWLEHDGDTIIVNPGNVAGVFHQATFAVLNTETKKLDLKIIADLK
jgi:putative phosphoesterase